MTQAETAPVAGTSLSELAAPEVSEAWHDPGLSGAGLPAADPRQILLDESVRETFEQLAEARQSLGQELEQVDLKISAASAPSWTSAIFGSGTSALEAEKRALQGKDGALAESERLLISGRDAQGQPISFRSLDQIRSSVGLPARYQERYPLDR